MATYPVLEHRASRTSRWLRTHRFRLAFLLAIAETALVITNVLSWRWVLLIAAIVFAFYFFVGRRFRNSTLRELSWTVALSQTMPVLVPVFVALAFTLAAVAVGILAIVVVAVLFLDRR